MGPLQPGPGASKHAQDAVVQLSQERWEIQGVCPCECAGCNLVVRAVHQLCTMAPVATHWQDHSRVTNSRWSPQTAPEGVGRSQAWSPRPSTLTPCRHRCVSWEDHEEPAAGPDSFGDAAVDEPLEASTCSSSAYDLHPNGGTRGLQRRKGKGGGGGRGGALLSEDGVHTPSMMDQEDQGFSQGGAVGASKALAGRRGSKEGGLLQGGGSSGSWLIPAEPMEHQPKWSDYHNWM